MAASVRILERVKLDFFGKLPDQLLEISVVANVDHFSPENLKGFLFCNRPSLR